jgi:DNA-binding transcriptional MerR regulator
MSAELPEKLYYSISEVAEMAGVKAHVLRYWEAEFPTLRPKKNRAGNRSYRERDINEVKAIKHLLYEEGYKIDGARRILSDRQARGKVVKPVQPRRKPKDELIEELRKGLVGILQVIDEMKS